MNMANMAQNIFNDECGCIGCDIERKTRPAAPVAYGEWIPYAVQATHFIDYYTDLSGDPPASYGSKFAAGPQLMLVSGSAGDMLISPFEPTVCHCPACVHSRSEWGIL